MRSSRCVELTGAVLAVPHGLCGHGCVAGGLGAAACVRSEHARRFLRTARVVCAVLGGHARVRAWPRAEARRLPSYCQEQGGPLTPQRAPCVTRGDLLTVAGVGAAAMLVRSPSVATGVLAALLLFEAFVVFERALGEPGCRRHHPHAGATRVCPLAAEHGDRPRDAARPVAPLGCRGESRPPQQWWHSCDRRAEQNAPFGGPQADLPQHRQYRSERQDRWRSPTRRRPRCHRHRAVHRRALPASP